MLVKSPGGQSQIMPHTKKDRLYLSFMGHISPQAVPSVGLAYLAFLVWLAAHLVANACKSPKRLSKSAPDAVTQ